MQVTTLVNHAERLRWSLRYRGLGVTMLSCLANACAFKNRDWYWKFKEREFDRRHGLDTSGMIPVDALAMPLIAMPSVRVASPWIPMTAVPEARPRMPMLFAPPASPTTPMQLLEPPVVPVTAWTFPPAAVAKTE